jgi:hypothetical protein
MKNLEKLSSQKLSKEELKSINAGTPTCVPYAAGIYSEQQQIVSVWNTLYNRKHNHQILKLLLTSSGFFMSNFL